MDTTTKHVLVDDNLSNVLNDYLPLQAYGGSTEDDSHAPASDNHDDSHDISFVSIHSFELDEEKILNSTYAESFGKEEYSNNFPMKTNMDGACFDTRIGEKLF